MAKRNHPRRGSMAFSPRKRSPRHFAHVNAWPETDASAVSYTHLTLPTIAKV